MGYAFRAFLACALIQVAAVAEATFHTYRIDEMYSNADGTVQYVVLHESLGMNGQNQQAGHLLTSTHAGVMKSYTFTGNLPGGTCGYYGCSSSPTANTRVLIGTEGFTALGLIAPDFVIPNGFLPTDGGSVNYAGVDQVTYTSLPTDGISALYRTGTVATNLATNFAGASVSVMLAGPPAAVNFQGLWWAAGGTESGWGINFAHQGDQVFGTWYTYDTSGKAWWLSMLANRTTGNTFSGPLYVDHGPPFNNFVGMGTPTQVGTGTLTFTDANNGSFSYTVNTTMPPTVQMKTIARYDLGTGPQPTCTYSAATPDFAAATNYQDLWWVANGAESGWGVNFAHQGNSVFATWYTYDVDGTPLWLSALAPRVDTSNVYSGTLYRTSGPRFDAFDPTKVLPVQVGTATLTFADGNHASFAYSTSGADGLPIASQSKQVTRFLFAAAGGTLCQ
jgi:hypothetical protein